LVVAVEEYNEFHLGGIIFLIFVLIADFLIAGYIWNYKSRKRKHDRNKSSFLKDLKTIRDLNDF
jgi:hypothetical protein